MTPPRFEVADRIVVSHAAPQYLFSKLLIGTQVDWRILRLKSEKRQRLTREVYGVVDDESICTSRDNWLGGWFKRWLWRSGCKVFADRDCKHLHDHNWRPDLSESFQNCGTVDCSRYALEANDTVAKADLAFGTQLQLV